MQIEILERSIDPAAFRNDFVAKRRPLLVRGYGKDWGATQKWKPEYFKQRFGDTSIQTKTFPGNGKIVLERAGLSSYMDSLTEYEDSLATSAPRARPAYWHDVPIFQMFEELMQDVAQFEPALLPRFYRTNWSQYVQFFMGPSGSVTKLHFDTLRTHNLFFQVSGRKTWTLLPPSDFERCGRRQWRWFDLDPEAPDLARFPEYRQARPVTVTIDSGDLLYIPPGTLHHVRSLDPCISFNIDFHTPSSVMDSFRFINRGMPREALYYNLISFLGLVLKLPEKLLFRFYKPYLNYVS